MDYKILDKKPGGGREHNSIGVAIPSFSNESTDRLKRIAALILNVRFNITYVDMFTGQEAFRAVWAKMASEEGKKKAAEGKIGLYLVK